MSQSKPQRMTTRAKNATHRPGLQLLQAEAEAYGIVKRRSKTEKAADDQRLKTAKEAHDTTVRNGYQAIAKMEAQMRNKQEKIMDDAPKPRRPQPRPIKTGNQLSAASKEQGQNKDLLDSGVKVPSTVSKESKSLKVKTVVRDAIQAVSMMTPTRGVIDQSTMRTRDNDDGKSEFHHARDSSIPAKFDVAGRVMGWGVKVPNGKHLKTRSTSTSLVSSTLPPQSSAPSSVLSHGTTASSSVYPAAPPSTPVHDTFADDAMSISSLDDHRDAMPGIITRTLNDANDVEDVDIMQADDVGETESNSELVDTGDFDGDLDIDSPPPRRLKRKTIDLARSDSLDSSDVEIEETTAAAPSVSRTTTSTGINITHKAPVGKRLKTGPATTTATIKGESDIDDLDHFPASVSQAASDASGAHGSTNPNTTAPPVKILPRSQYRVHHLPQGSQPRWSSKFLPTLLAWLGDQPDIWVVDEDVLCDVLQAIWDVTFYNRVNHTITTDGPVIAIVLQRLSEWRNSLGSIAFVVLADFFNCQEDITTDEDRRNLAQNLLTKFNFVYENIAADGTRINAFHSQLIIQVVAHHMATIWDAVEVPGLSMGRAPSARGAISLATAAMERALRMFANGDILLQDIDLSSKGKKAVKIPLKHNKATGKDSRAVLSFSDLNWGDATRSFMKSLNRHGEETILSVSSLARNVVTKRRRSAIKEELDDGGNTLANDDSDDERAHLP
ncbi:hypothetical protein BJ138DRAFT_1100611 [Hygrophoropsis aurantiaca]|uniref:Uncharacterized protein n=1 Tax=Hygrophoropsis aurantiaca TaxID=72124 RepID=A0ACB8AGE6_9AGAM|nr:hypothetical protein BJ138DRAFT_1100611 [Hygrophoropsis aurantiaca]